MVPGYCTISFLRGASAAARFSEFRMAELSQVFFLPAGAGFDIQVPAGFETVYIRFDQQQLLDALRILDAGKWEQVPERLTSFITPGAGQLEAFIDQIFRAMPGGSEARQLSDPAYLSRAILDNAARTVAEAAHVDGEAPDYRGRRRALRMVHGVRDYIDACLEQGHCPSIVEICAHVGVSQRTLQYGFRELLQMTPVAYLRTLRLNRVRVELRAPSPVGQTVTGTATRWGFLHLGKFAQDYRQMFGESPKETLHRATPRSYPLS